MHLHRRNAGPILRAKLDRGVWKYAEEEPGLRGPRVRWKDSTLFSESDLDSEAFEQSRRVAHRWMHTGVTHLWCKREPPGP